MDELNGPDSCQARMTIRSYVLANRAFFSPDFSVTVPRKAGLSGKRHL